MNTVAVRMSIGAPLGQLKARGIDAIRQELVHARGLLQNSEWGPLDEPGSRTEGARERRFHVGRPIDDEWGRSESIDPDNVGDIADEGMGHRG